MKSVQFSDHLKQVKSLYLLAERATKQLDEVLGPSAPLVAAEWDHSEDDRGRSVLTLRIRDFTGEATARFAPQELEDQAQMRYRLYRLWGDLLQVRSHKELDYLKGPGGTPGD